MKYNAVANEVKALQRAYALCSVCLCVCVFVFSVRVCVSVLSCLSGVCFYQGAAMMMLPYRKGLESFKEERSVSKK